jgi:hypothetical protein
MTCAAACTTSRALVCGDQDGRVLFFALPPALVGLLGSCCADTVAWRPEAVAAAAAAAGASLPAHLELSTRVLPGAANQVGLVKEAADGFLSAGHDGLLRFYSHSHYAPAATAASASATATATATAAAASASAQPPLQPAWGLSGSLRIPTIPTIHAVFASRMAGSAHGTGTGTGGSSSATSSHAYVGGFQGSDMVMYSTAHQAEVRAAGLVLQCLYYTGLCLCTRVHLVHA